MPQNPKLDLEPVLDLEPLDLTEDTTPQIPGITDVKFKDEIPSKSINVDAIIKEGKSKGKYTTPILGGLRESFDRYLLKHIDQLAEKEPGILNPDINQNPIVNQSQLPLLKHDPNEGWLSWAGKGAYNNLIQPLASPLGILGATGLANPAEVPLPKLPSAMKPRMRLVDGKLVPVKESAKLLMKDGSVVEPKLTGPTELGDINLSPTVSGITSNLPEGAKNRLFYRWQQIVDELDSSNAPDTAYRDIMSTGGKTALKKGETWRGRVLKYIESDKKRFYESLNISDDVNHLASNIVTDRRGRPLDPAVFDNPIAKLIIKLREARPLTKEQQILNKQARAEKATKLKSLGSRGEQLVEDTRKALQGKHEKVSFEPLNLDENDFGALTDTINETVSDSFDHARAVLALGKITRGAVPQPAEIKLLSSIFTHRLTRDLKDPNAARFLANELVDNLSRRSPIMDRATDEMFNMSKSLMSSIDFSAPGRQGLPFISRKEFWTSLDDMVKSWGSEKASEAVMKSIQEMPNFETMMKAGLSITDPHSITNREELFLSRLAHNIPGVKRSERAYSGFLNKLRADTFERMYNEGLKVVDPKDKNAQTLLAYNVSQFINSMTGRGPLKVAGYNLESHADLLNKMFYSPRLMGSRIYMIENTLKPQFYIKQPPVVRKEMLRSALALAGFTAGANGLGYLAGGALQGDPRSSDFGKIQFGKTRIDPGAGVLQYLTLASRMIDQATTNTEGKTTEFSGKFGGQDGLTTVGRFLRNKLSPMASLGMKGMERFNPYEKGEEYNMPAEVAKTFTPLIAQDIWEILHEDNSLSFPDNLAPQMPSDPKALMAIPLTAVGMGSQTY